MVVARAPANFPEWAALVDERTRIADQRVTKTNQRNHHTQQGLRRRSALAGLLRWSLKEPAKPSENAASATDQLQRGVTRKKSRRA